MTSYETDVHGMQESFSVDSVTDDGESVSITGTHANGDEVTVEISLRVVHWSDGIDIGPDTVALHGPARETDEGVEDAELSIAYSSDVPRDVKETFRDYTSENQTRLLEAQSA